MFLLIVASLPVVLRQFKASTPSIYLLTFVENFDGRSDVLTPLPDVSLQSRALTNI
jgi:hypothetical protein